MQDCLLFLEMHINKDHSLFGNTSSPQEAALSVAGKGRLTIRSGQAGMAGGFPSDADLFSLEPSYAALLLCNNAGLQAHAVRTFPHGHYFTILQRKVSS